MLIGPLAAFEALAIDDFIRSSQTPILTVAGAEDMTQRKANPWLVRPSSTSAQPSHPLGDYAAKDMKLKRVAVLADDFAFGHENVAGFQRVFEDGGGKVVQKIFTPLNAPDYGTYISQLKPNLDAVYSGHAGSNAFKFCKQLREYGNKMQILGSFTPVRRVAAAADGRRRARLDQRQLVFGRSSTTRSTSSSSRRIQRDYKVDPGVYAAETYLCGEVLEHAAKAIGGKIEDKNALNKALHEAKVPDTLRGPVSFDKYGNVVGNIFIRKVEKKGGKLVNTVVKTYPDVEPVLDLQRGRVPEEPGLFARLSAGEESGELDRNARRLHRRLRCERASGARRLRGRSDSESVTVPVRSAPTSCRAAPRMTIAS